jgi:hypothetical protein
MREPTVPNIPRLHPVKLTVDEIALVQHLVLRHLCRMDAFADKESLALFELQFTERYTQRHFWRVSCANATLSQTLDKLLAEGETLTRGTGGSQTAELVTSVNPSREQV